MSLKGNSVEIEFSAADFDCRSVIRQSDDIAYHYEIAHQAYDYGGGCWVDVDVTPAYCKEDLESLRDSLGIIQEWFA